MKLEEQVTSLELSRKLKEIGIKQESLFYWANNKIVSNDEIEYLSSDKNYILLTTRVYNDFSDELVNEIFSAFTAPELLEMFPKRIDKNPFSICLTNDDSIYAVMYGTVGHFLWFKDENLCNALTKMLIHLIENNLMEIK